MALRIKSNVDLKELEKYGFKYYGDYDLKRYEKHNIVIYENSVDYQAYIKAHCLPIIERVIYVKEPSKDEFGFFIENFNKMYIENVVYDLIKADLVEKVGE